MKTNRTSVQAAVNRWGPKKWIVCAVALVSFLTGSLTTAHLIDAGPARADNDRVFELDIYHAIPGKIPALVSRFHGAANLFAKHNLKAMGYWVADDGKTFVYLIAHRSRDEAKKNWAAFHADPQFQKYLKSEQAIPLIERVDETYMWATNFSALR